MAVQIPAFATDQQYPFWQLRKMMSAFSTPGVVSPSTDFIVSPSSGLQVQITAGSAFVQQTVNIEGSSAYNGLYYVINDATANPFNTITAPTVNARIDQVILKVYDVQEQGLGGTSKGQLEWLPGSENASASLATMGPGLSNPGATALPANSLRLAYVLQTVGESSISSGNILNVAPTAMPSSLLAAAAVSSSSTLTAGQVAIAAPSTTQTLPPPQAGARVKVIANASVTGSTQVSVAYGLGTGKIFGVGLSSSGVTSFPLGTALASATLASDGTSWYIVDGQQDTGWVALALQTGVSAINGTAPAARRYGDHVELSGSMSASGFTTWATIPAAMTPAHQAGNANGSIQITTSGLLQTSASQTNLYIDGVSYRLI